MATTIGTGPMASPCCSSTAPSLQTLFDFVIIAFVLFMALKGINRLKKPAANAPPPAPPRNEVLLEEIRDLLKKK